LDVLSPGRPLGEAPVPITPGVEVFGTPGWFTPVLLPVVADRGVVAAGGGVAGETPGDPAAEPPGDDGGAVCADAASVDAASEAAISAVKSNLRRMRTSVAMCDPTHLAADRSGEPRNAFNVSCRENSQRAAVRVLEHSLKLRIMWSAGFGMSVMRIVVAFALLCSVSAPCLAQDLSLKFLKKEPYFLSPSSVVFVADGTCGVGKVKKVTGELGALRRKRVCVPMGPEQASRAIAVP
jgi:hypothetical protein